MSSKISKDEALENAIKISTTKHRLFSQSQIDNEIWAECIVYSGAVYHYLPVSHDYFPSLLMHEMSGHDFDNMGTKFQIMALLRDFVAEWDKIKDKRYRDALFESFYLNKNFPKFEKFANFIEKEWSNASEASAYLSQLLSFLTPPILREKIIEELCSKKRDVFNLGEMLAQMAFSFACKWKGPKGLEADEIAFWQYQMLRNKKDLEFAHIKYNISKDLYDERVTLLTINQMAKRSIARSIFSLDLSPFSYPRLSDVIKIIYEDHESQVPEWIKLEEIIDFVQNKAYRELGVKPYHPLLSGSLFALFLYLGLLVREGVFDEILEENIFGLCRMLSILLPVYFKESIDIYELYHYFPVINYVAPSFSEKSKRKIFRCTNMVSPLPRIKILKKKMSKVHLNGFAKAMASLVPIRNTLFTKCSESCKNRSQCPVQHQLYCQVKRVWNSTCKDITTSMR